MRIESSRSLAPGGAKLPGACRVAQASAKLLACRDPGTTPARNKELEPKLISAPAAVAVVAA